MEADQCADELITDVLLRWVRHIAFARLAAGSDLRNGIAHADYVVSPSEGVYVRGRHDRSRLIRFPELESIV